MAIVKRLRKLVNPGRKRVSRSRSRNRVSRKRVRKVSRNMALTNVGELVTLSLGNSGKKKNEGRMSMASRRIRRTNKGRVANTMRRRYAMRKVSNGYRVKSYRRRNPDARGLFESVGGVIGGATLTGVIVGMIPPEYTSGMIGYGVTAVTAYAQGMVVGKVMKNQRLGDQMIVGGMTVLVLKLLSDFLPNLSLGLAPRGLGWIYAKAPMTTAAMGRPFLAYNQPSALPSGLIDTSVPAVTSNGNGMAGFNRGRVGFGR